MVSFKQLALAAVLSFQIDALSIVTLQPESLTTLPSLNNTVLAANTSTVVKRRMRAVVMPFVMPQPTCVHCTTVKHVVTHQVVHHPPPPPHHPPPHPNQMHNQHWNNNGNNGNNNWNNGNNNWNNGNNNGNNGNNINPNMVFRKK